MLSSTLGKATVGLFVLLTSYFIVYTLSEYTFVRIHIASSNVTYIKLYWATIDDSKFSEKRSGNLRINSNKRHYILPIRTSLSGITKLRLDTGRKRGTEITIGKLSLHNLTSQTILFDSKKLFSGFQPNKDIGKLEIRDTRIKFTNLGSDPFFLVEMPEVKNRSSFFLHLFWTVSLFLLILILLRTSRGISKNLNFVPIALLMVACFIFSMATFSKRDQHPDEDTHISAAGYYANHYCPPEVCSAESIHTYTVYGVSRLDKREIYYFLTGRYLALTDFLPVASFLKLRYFNVALFFVLVLLSFHSRAFRFLSLPLLLSPQIWYLFSYFNSDAFSFFVVMVAGYQIFSQNSILRKILSGKIGVEKYAWGLMLSVLFASHYWVKLNYFFYPLYLLSLGGAWMLINGKPTIPAGTNAVVIAAIVGSTLFFSWTFLRHHVNDFELGERVAECQEITAGSLFKPSTPPDKQHLGFRLKEKGTSLLEMVTASDNKWLGRIIYTGLGAYGYTEYLNSLTHYRIACLSLLGFFLYISYVILSNRNLFHISSLIIAILSFFGLVFAAAINNWTADFQPQGRYLAVAFPILGVLLFIARKNLSLAVLYFLTLIPLFFGIYSFISNGMIEILNVA